MRSTAIADASVGTQFNASFEASASRPARRSPLSPSELSEAREAWRAAAKARSLSAESMAAWMILLGKDPRKAFTPITNPVKLANGATAWGSYEAALRSARSLERSALAPWAALLERSGCAPGDRPWSAWKGEHPILKALASFQDPAA